MIKEKSFKALLNKRAFNYKKVGENWYLDVKDISDYIDVLLSKGIEDPILSQRALKELKMALEEILEHDRYVKKLRLN